MAKDNVKENRQPTNFEVTMHNMTVELMAVKNVKLITVNNSQLFWITSTGQLFNFENQQQAIELETRWLNSPCSEGMTGDNSNVVELPNNNK